MSSLSKQVILATKPKRAAPKAKYIDPIVQGTFGNEGGIQEIVKALSNRLRDDNTTVVFKSLIVLHTLLRVGSLESTYSYLTTSSISLSLGSHEAPNISAYAAFLAARIKSYNNLKRDVIRDKSDRRATGRLRSLTVDGGLLREVREVQRMIASLVESKFYTDDIDDDVSMTALRLLVKDLLVLFQAVNEGVINVLEHYFEMSHVDATTALKIYKTFCRDTEKVVLYLGVAKKLQDVLNVPIPNLKHAPVSLVGSLEEYLNDPNFATNREEYKENKRIADGGAPNPAKAKAVATPPNAVATSSSDPAPSLKAPTSFTDFFESIEQSQTTMFNPSNDSPTTQYFQQQATFNPFLQQQSGMSYAQQQQGMMIPQMTGMGYSAFGGVAPNPFGLPQQQQQFMQPQLTGYMQPQMTGVNPFRQNSIPPMPMMNNSPFASTSSPFQSQPPQFIQSQPTGAFAPSPFAPQISSPFTAQLQSQPTGAFGSNSPFGQIQNQPQQPFSALPPQFQPQRQASSPFPSSSSVASSPFAPTSTTIQAPTAQALVGQKTGARNPFAPGPGEMPIPTRAPSGPSMNAMAYSAFGNGSQVDHQQQQMNSQQAFGSVSQPQQQQPFQSQSAFSSNSFSSTPAFQSQTSSAQPLTASKTGGLMGSIASDFAFTRSASPTSFTSSPFAPIAQASSTAPSSISAFSNYPTTSSPTSSNFNTNSQVTPTPLFTQATGYGGSSVRPFQPTSSFGSALQDEFSTSSATAFGQQQQSQPQQSQQQQQPQQQIQPQATGFNPFRGSTLPPLNETLNGNGNQQQSQQQQQQQPLGGAFQSNGSGFSTFGNSNNTGSLI